MADETNIYTDNLSRAGVTGKVPQAGARNAANAKAKPGKMTRDRKGHAKRLKKRGLISDKAAQGHGL